MGGVSLCILFYFLTLLLALVEVLSSLSSVLIFFVFNFVFLSSLEESSTSLEEAVLEEEESEQEDDKEDEPFFFFDGAAFTLSLSIRPFLARRRAMPSSVFFASFLFFRCEPFAASFSMKLAVPLVILGVVAFPVEVRRQSGRGALFLLLLLVIPCLCEHRSTGGNFHTH